MVDGDDDDDDDDDEHDDDDDDDDADDKYDDDWQLLAFPHQRHHNPECLKFFLHQNEVASTRLHWETP